MPDRRRRPGAAHVSHEEEDVMGIGLSLILVAAGAVLTWAVSAEVSGVDLQTVGVILMVVGIVGALLSLVFWSSWGGFGTTHRETIIRDRDHVVER
jgi:hypothetical protein